MPPKTIPYEQFVRNERQYAFENRMAFMSQLATRYGWKCMCCGCTRNLTLDHIRPIAMGGETVLENLQILCYRCNREKGCQVIDYRKGQGER